MRATRLSAMLNIGVGALGLFATGPGLPGLSEQVK